MDTLYLASLCTSSDCGVVDFLHCLGMSNPCRQRTLTCTCVLTLHQAKTPG